MNCKIINQNLELRNQKLGVWNLETRILGFRSPEPQNQDFRFQNLEFRTWVLEPGFQNLVENHSTWRPQGLESCPGRAAHGPGVSTRLNRAWCPQGGLWAAVGPPGPRLRVFQSVQHGLLCLECFRAIGIIINYRL